MVATLKNMESQNIEFKSKWRDEYFKVICSFANADGGRLIIGVDKVRHKKALGYIKTLAKQQPNTLVAKLQSRHE